MRVHQLVHVIWNSQSLSFPHRYIYRPIFNSWQSGSGDLHAAPFPPMGFVTAALSRDPIKWVGAPYHVTCHVTFVCTLPSLPSDTPWRMNTSLGLIRPADRVCNECRSSVTWPLALYTRKSGSQIHKVKSKGKFFQPILSTKLCRTMFSRMLNKMKMVISIKESSKGLKM